MWEPFVPGSGRLGHQAYIRVLAFIGRRHSSSRSRAEDPFRILAHNRLQRDQAFNFSDSHDSRVGGEQSVLGLC